MGPIYIYEYIAVQCDVIAGSSLDGQFKYIYRDFLILYILIHNVNKIVINSFFFNLIILAKFEAEE